MDWLSTSWGDALRIVSSTLGIYALVILAIRLNGLRSLSKMSSFDFVMSIAVGTIVASTLLNPSPSLAEGGIALGTVFLLQRVVAVARRRADASFVDNPPAILMVGERMLEDALTRTRVTSDDVRGKLREVNVIDLDEVHLVVLEATGDVSVLHGSDGAPLDARVVEGIDGIEDALAELERARPGSVRHRSSR